MFLRARQLSVPILSPTTLVHNIPSYLSKIHSNIIPPHLRLGLARCLLPSAFPNHDVVHFSPLPISATRATMSAHVKR
jgi:hypothetical protein